MSYTEYIIIVLKFEFYSDAWPRPARPGCSYATARATDFICVAGWQIGKRQGIQVEYVSEFDNNTLVIQPLYIYIFMQITEDMIDFYQVLGCSPETISVNNTEALEMCEEIQSYPLCFKLLFSPDGSPSENTQMKLSLHGLTNKYCATVEFVQDKAR